MKLPLPAVQTLGSEAAMIDPVFSSAADPDHPAILDRDLQPAAIAAQ
jgi:hypothetical protein